MIRNRTVEQALGDGEAPIDIGLLLPRDDQPEWVGGQAHFHLHLVQRRLRLAALWPQGVPGLIQPGPVKAQNDAGREQNQTCPRHGRAARLFRWRKVRGCLLLRRDEITPPGGGNAVPGRRSASRKQRGQVDHHHNQSRQANPEGDERAQLRQPGQSAQVQHQERAHRGDGRPKNTRRNGPADFRHGQLRVRQRFLVVDHGIIHGQSEQHGGKSHAHHADAPQNQAAQRQRRGQDQRQQRQEPEHRQPAPVRQPKQQRDDRGRPDHRAAHIVLHAGGDFLHKHRPSGKANHDAGPLLFRLAGLKVGHDRAHGFQPTLARTITRQVHR